MAAENCPNGATQSGSGTNWEMSVVGRAVRLGNRDWLENMTFYLNGRARDPKEMPEPDWMAITPGLGGRR